MTRTPKSIVVAGVMSGTSADGVDVAMVRVSPGRDGVPKIKLLGHVATPYPKTVREAVLRLMDGGETNAAEMSRLNWRLGEVYADAVEKTIAKLGLKIALVGMHGQTIYHQAIAAKYAGRPVRATWQVGEAAVVAERLRIPVVSDFRPADLAAGGQAAPLVPMLDYCVFRSKTRNRVLLNLGGIANMTPIPAGCALGDVIAFDSGPANMVVDALMQREFGKPFDRGGRVAARGSELPRVVAEAMSWGYFNLGAPKSCGREQFGAEFVERFRGLAGEASGENMIATATALTWRSIYEAYARICWPHLGQRAPLAHGTDLIAAGGGTRNAFLMARLRDAFTPLGVNLLVADEMGIPAQAKEAMAFALLAWLSWHGLPGNVPSATGATRPAVLGKVSLG